MLTIPCVRLDGRFVPIVLTLPHHIETKNIETDIIGMGIKSYSLKIDVNNFDGLF